jgi:hypothetical protein
MKVLTRFTAIAIGVIALTVLSACSSPSGPGPLLAPDASGAVTLVSQTGHGDKELGTFTASGTLSLSGSCVGPGLVRVSIPPLGEALKVSCSTAKDTAGQLATVDIPLASRSTFRLEVSAARTTTWTLAGAATKR